MVDFVETMAGMGQGGDTMLAHVSPGEIVIPREIQDQMPQVVQAFIKAMTASGANWRQYVVGSPEGNINEETGLQEFFFNLYGGTGNIVNTGFGSVALPSLSTGGASPSAPAAPANAPGGSDFEKLTPRQQRAAIATFGLYGENQGDDSSLAFFKDLGGDQLLPVEEQFLERASITNPEAQGILDTARAPAPIQSNQFFNNLLNGSGIDVSRFL